MGKSVLFLFGLAFLAGCDFVNQTGAALYGFKLEHDNRLDISDARSVPPNRENLGLYDRLSVDPGRGSLAIIRVSPELPPTWYTKDEDNRDEIEAGIFFRRCDPNLDFDQELAGIRFFRRTKQWSPNVLPAYDRQGNVLHIPTTGRVEVSDIAYPLEDSSNEYVVAFYANGSGRRGDPATLYLNGKPPLAYQLEDGERICIRLRDPERYRFGRERAFIFRQR